MHPSAHAATVPYPTTDTPPTATYPLSLHDALPISAMERSIPGEAQALCAWIRGRSYKKLTKGPVVTMESVGDCTTGAIDRKSTRLNSSHVKISYAVFCLKKKRSINIIIT